MDPSIWGGFLIGFLGSFHCVGMCGPIALALPIGNSSNFEDDFTIVEVAFG